MPDPERPNLFNFATKELSQDAMICWLIQWADDKYADVDPELHECGREFVAALLCQHADAHMPARVETKIIQQDRGIDVLARVSEDHVLLIEDKTGSSDHSGQLQRYYDHVASGRTRLGDVAKESVYPIYLKTGNQPRSKDLQIEDLKEGFHRPYKVFSRPEFLEVLCSYDGDHHALTDYREYLEWREKETLCFPSWEQHSRSSWSWWSWEGFYRYLEEQLELGDDPDEEGWSYVANAAGGFLGFYWCRIGADDGAHIYLQLETDVSKNRQLLCFKVGGAAYGTQQDLKWKWNERVLKAGAGTVEKPPVMRAGWTMTVARWKGDWLAFGKDRKIDLAGTVQNLRRAEEILRMAAEMTE